MDEGLRSDDTFIHYDGLVEGHTFDPMQTPWDRTTWCRVRNDGLGGQECGRSYEEHAIRPPLPYEALEKETGSMNPYGFMDAHKFGCASVTEVQRAACNCGYVPWNLGALMFLAEHGLHGYESHIRWKVQAEKEGSEMSSSEFRMAYAGLEQPTTVTVNGRPIGVWTPLND